MYRLHEILQRDRVPVVGSVRRKEQRRFGSVPLQLSQHPIRTAEMLHVLAEEALQVKSHCTSATFPHSSCKWNDGHDEELPGAFARPLRRSHDHVVPRDFLPPPIPHLT